MQPNCAYCEDQGLVVVGLHEHYKAMYEEMGPCPMCQKGNKIEFGTGDEKRRGTWGENGFWQGRPHRLVKPEPKVFLSREENVKRMKELVGKIGAGFREMPTDAAKGTRK